MVRNPFARILSAFREKIELQVDGPRYRKEFGIALDEDISFGNFVEKLVKRDPLTLDMHFMPQSLIMRPDIVHYDKLFHLETTMDEALSWLDALLVGASLTGARNSVAPHATNASERAKTAYSDAVLKAVSTYYASDFSHFGYVPDLQSLAPRKVPQMPGITPVQSLQMGSFSKIDSQLRGLLPMLLQRH